ncbi:MAG: hypothetical protein GX139_07845 [Armatimonadetes bacterium]|nr:hypothetical protein [Armatimonadota bacterium]
MKAKALTSLIAIVCIGIVSICGTVWALDEAVLTPTNSNVRSTEDKVFEAATARSIKPATGGIGDAIGDWLGRHGIVW